LILVQEKKILLHIQWILQKNILKLMQIIELEKINNILNSKNKLLSVTND